MATITNTEIEAMIERLTHNGPYSREWHVCMVGAAEMLRELLDERAWQDMASAPRDGTRFLARGSYIYPGDKFPTVYTDIVKYSGDESYPWRVDGDGNHPSCSFDKWLSLPAPETGEQ